VSTKTNFPGHLSDEQIDDYLIGDLGGDAADHLEGCLECMARVQQMDSAISSFKTVSLAWSERRSATMPLRTSEPARWSGRRVWSYAGSSAVAAALVIGLLVPVMRHENRSDAASVKEQPVMMAASGAVSSTLPGEEQIRQDNQMLRDIDQALATGSETPAALGLQTTSSPARSHTQSAAFQD